MNRGLGPVPTLLAPSTAQTIRDALVGAERTEFEQRFAQAMCEVADTLDLTEVIEVLNVFHRVAEITQ